MNSIFNRFFYFASLLVIAGILLKISGQEIALPVMLTGSIWFASVRIISALKNKDRKRSRLPMIQMMSAISLLVAAYFMYKMSNSWAVFILITAVLESYASFRMDDKK